jgi:hypothetical protein
MITPHGTAQVPADSKTVKPREASTGQASGREAATGMATGRRESATGQASGREAASGMATGRITDHAATQDSLNARNSAQATESVTDAAKTGSNKAGNVQSNPLYKGDGKSGQNPLHESKDKTACKDGEDPVTRSHSGNNKTSK